MPDLRNITVNGVPLDRVIDEEVREEVRSHHQTETATMGKIVSHSRSSSSNNNRNISGSRSGRVRVICCNGVWQ